MNDTKEKLIRCFIELVERGVSVDSITVSAIIAEADVSRVTFYYHFNDIFDLIRHVIKHNSEMIKELRNSHDGIEPHISSFLGNLTDRKSLIQQVMLSSKRFYIEAVIIENLRDYFADMLDNPDQKESYGLAYAIYGIMLGIARNDIESREAASIIQELTKSIQ